MFTWFTFFDISTACNDDVNFTRSKRVNEEIILHYTSSKKTSSHAKFQAQSLQGLSVLHRYSLHYNVLSGQIIISLSRSKGINGTIICLCTSSDENLFTCKISGQKLPRILSYASS